jgi:hypothetical protein
MDEAKGLQDAGDRRLTTVAILLALSVMVNIAFGAGLGPEPLPPPVLPVVSNITAELAAAQVRLLAERVAVLEAELEKQTGNVARIQRLSDSRQAYVAALLTVIDRNKDAHLAAMREREARARELVLRASSRIGGRVAGSVQRSVAAMVGEAVPAFGVGVIVATTALEVKDACTNLQDIYELNTAFAPDLSDGENRDHVCGITVPTVEELKLGALSRLESIGKTLQDTLPEWAGGDTTVKSD